jgi:hypothetical protein
MSLWSKFKHYIRHQYKKADRLIRFTLMVAYASVIFTIVFLGLEHLIWHHLII